MIPRFVTIGLLTCLACAQSPTRTQPAPGRIETRTRLVAIFSDLNQQMFHAIQSRDSAALQHLLGEDFELRTADAPTAPKSRGEWEANAFRRPPDSFRISQMAVRGLHDEVAIASFLLQESYKEPPGSAEFFVVEAWTLDGDNWLCQEAYFSPMKTIRPAPAKDRKPTGKD